MKSGGQSDSVGVISDDPIRWSWIKISNPVLKSHWRPFERHLIEPFSGAGNSIHPARLYSAFGAIEWTIDSIKLKNIIIFRSCTKISDSRRKIYLKSLNDFIANFNISIWNESLLARFDLLWKVFFFSKIRAQKCIFRDNNLQQGISRDIYFQKHIFRDTYLRQCIFRDIYYQKCIFREFFCKKGIIRDIHFQKCIFRDINFQKCIFRDIFFKCFFFETFIFKNLFLRHYFPKFIFRQKI